MGSSEMAEDGGKRARIEVEAEAKKSKGKRQIGQPGKGFEVFGGWFGCHISIGTTAVPLGHPLVSGPWFINETRRVKSSLKVFVEKDNRKDHLDGFAPAESRKEEKAQDVGGWETQRSSHVGTYGTR